MADEESGSSSNGGGDGNGPLPFEEPSPAELSSEGAAVSPIQPGSYDSGSGVELSMMEQAEQMMVQMEQEDAQSGACGEGEQDPQAQVAEAVGAHSASPYAGALRLSSGEREQRQTGNVFRVIRQQMRGNRSLYGHKLADAQRVFALMDTDGSGTMTTDEFSDALTRLGLGLTAVQVAEVLAAVDADGSGTIEYDEFVALLGTEFGRPVSAPARVPRSLGRGSRRVASTSAGVARSRKVYGNRDALGFEDPPELSEYRHVPVYQSCFPVYVNRVFQKAAPDLATSNRITQETKEELLEELRPVPTDLVNSKTLPATMHAQHAIEWPGGKIPSARPTSAAAMRSAGSGRPPAGRRRPQSAASNLQRRSITMSKEAKVEREVENVFRVISQQLRGKRTLYGEVMAEARDVFNLMDKDRSRTLDKTEFATALQRMGLGLTEDQVEEVIAVVDKDGNGTIEYREFVALLGAEWSRPRSAPPAKTRFGASQRPRSGGSRSNGTSSTSISASVRRPGSAPVMDRYSNPPQYPNGWKPRPQKKSKDGRLVQHVPAVSNADMSHWGWEKTPGAPGHKTWVDDYKGGVVIEQLTPRRAAWNDQIARDPQHSARPANLGWCKGTMTADSMGRPQSAPARTALRREQRAMEIEASIASNAHFSRWKPRRATPSKPRKRETSSSKVLEPVQQEIEVQTDLLADYRTCSAVVLQPVAAGGFSMNTAGYEVFCRVRFGKHELETPSLPAQVPHPLPKPMPLCMFGEPDCPRSDNFVLIDCFGRADGETRSIHCGSLRLDFTQSDLDPHKLRFFKFAHRDEVVRESPTPKSAKMRRMKSYGFGLPQEPLNMGTGSESGEWNEVFADTTGSPPSEACPEGWLALRMDFVDQAGDTEGTTREALEKAAQRISQEAAKSLGTLTVTVCRGRRLPQAQDAQKMLDPVCQVHYRNETVSSSVAFNTCHPVWDETFTFDVTDLDEDLRFMVYDWKADAEKCDLVGAAAIDILQELDDFEESERWVELYVLRPDRTLRRRGDIFCRLNFVPAIAAPTAGSPRTDLLIGTSAIAICLQLECIEARGLLVSPNVKLCCIVSLLQPLHETQSQTSPALYGLPGDGSIELPEGDDRSECSVKWKHTVDLALCEPTAVVRVDVAIVPEKPRRGHEVLGGFVVPAAHLIPGSKHGEWFQLLDILELNGPTDHTSGGSVDDHKAGHTHAAALYFDKELPSPRARKYENVKWRDAQKLGQAALQVRSKVEVRRTERVSAISPNSSAPPGSLLDEHVLGSVSVSVIRAAGLPTIRGPRGLKEPDPFVQVFHGSDQHITSTVRRSRSPCWVDGEQQQDWFTFPVTTTRSIVQFKVCSRALVGPHTVLGSLSIGLREMIASASKIGTELPDPADPGVQVEHKLLGVSDHDLDIRQGDKRRSTKKLKENGILQVAMHLQLRSLDGAPNMLPVTRRLRSVMLTSDLLSNDSRFEVIDEDDEAAPESVSRKPPRQISHNIVASDGAIMCVQISVLECTALHSKGQGDAVRPLIRLRLYDPQRNAPVDAADVDNESQCNLSEEQKKALQTRPEILMVALNMQSIFRGKLARKDYRKKKKSLEILSSNQAPCKFDDRTFRLHTNRFSQQLVVDVLDDSEPGKLPTFLGSIEMPVASLTLPSFTGDHWHIVSPPTNGNLQKVLTKVATKLQAHVRAKQQYADFKRRTQAPLHVIYLLGGPGSGKTALGKRLADNLGLIHFSSGEMLRRALRQKENAHVTSRIRLAMEEGVPVPNDVILPLLRRAIARLRYHRDGGTILLDGVPFSDAQRDLLETIPTDELPGPARVFLLDCDEDTMISRSMNRADGLRDDCTEEAVNSMVATFRKAGMPVAEHYEKHGILTKIDTGRAATEDESYGALVSSLTTCMVDAGYWSAPGEPFNRSKETKETSGTRTAADRQGEIPKVPALRLRISARRSGVAGASRMLIGVMKWRRQARQRAQAKAQAAVDAATSAAAVSVVKLGVVTEDDKEEQGEVRGSLTVEV